MKPAIHFLAAAMLTLCACAPTHPWPAERHLQNDPPAVRERAVQITSDDPAIRTTSTEQLINDGVASLPLLRRFLQTADEKLHRRTLEIIRHIGPDALPLLADMLDHPRISIRRETVSILIDLA